MKVSQNYVTADGKTFTDAGEAYSHEQNIKAITILSGIAGLSKDAVQSILANISSVSEALKIAQAKKKGRKAGKVEVKPVKTAAPAKVAPKKEQKGKPAVAKPADAVTA